jgi:hypothetical protein
MNQGEAEISASPCFLGNFSEAQAGLYKAILGEFSIFLRIRVCHSGRQRLLDNDKEK